MRIKIKQVSKPKNITLRHKSLTKYSEVKVTTGTLEHTIRNTLYRGAK